jgi:hypothetical protein
MSQRRETEMAEAMRFSQPDLGRVIDVSESPKIIALEVLRGYGLGFKVIRPAKDELGRDLPGFAKIEPETLTALALLRLLCLEPEITILDTAVSGIDKTLIFSMGPVRSPKWENSGTETQVSALFKTSQARNMRIDAQDSHTDRDTKRDYLSEAGRLENLAKAQLRIAGITSLSGKDIKRMVKKVIAREMPNYLKETGELDEIAIWQAVEKIPSLRQSLPQSPLVVDKI